MPTEHGGMPQSASVSATPWKPPMVVNMDHGNAEEHEAEHVGVAGHGLEQLRTAHELRGSWWRSEEHDDDGGRQVRERVLIRSEPG